MLPVHQLQGELAIPVPEYGHPHATNNGSCSRDVPGPTNSLPLRPRSGALTAAPRISTAQTAGICRRTRKRVTGMARPCAHNVARPHPPPMPVPSTTRHARTCNRATPRLRKRKTHDDVLL